MLYMTLIAGALFLGISIALSDLTPSYYINFSNSEPLGIYRLIPFDGSLKRGDRVVMKPPKQALPYIYGRCWLPDGWLLIKNVGALPGDSLLISDKAIYINGQFTGPVSQHDSQGMPLPRLRGCFKIDRGLFLPISTYIPNSFDGRYFGPVPFGLIRGKAILLFRF